MKTLKLPPILMALLLHFAPATKLLQSSLPTFSFPFAVVFRWAATSAILMGSHDAVSGASTAVQILSPTTAEGTVGEPFTYIITQSSTYTDIGHTFFASPLPAGLIVTTYEGNGLPAYGIISGIPTESGIFEVTLRARFQNDHHPNEPIPSTNLTLTVRGIPNIVTPPLSQSVKAGESASFKVVARGVPSPTFQWFHNDVAIPNQQGDELQISSTQVSDAGSYQVVVSNSFGSVTSAPPALLVVNPSQEKVTFTRHPASRSVIEGENVTFSVTVTGGEPIHYQWKKDGKPLTADGPTLTLNAVGTADEGSYTVAAGNDATPDVESDAALLRVFQRPHFLGISTVGDAIKLEFHAIQGGLYQVLYADSPTSGNWQPLGEPISPQQTGHQQITSPLTSQDRFYQIQLTLP